MKGRGEENGRRKDFEEFPDNHTGRVYRGSNDSVKHDTVKGVFKDYEVYKREDSRYRISY